MKYERLKKKKKKISLNELLYFHKAALNVLMSMFILIHIFLSLNPYLWCSSLRSLLIHANRTRATSRTGPGELAWREVLVR